MPTVIEHGVLPRCTAVHCIAHLGLFQTKRSTRATRSVFPSSSSHPARKDSDETRKTVLKAEFDKISAEVFRLDHLVSNAAHALPAFELWKHSTSSKQLRSELANLRAKKLPRQPFKFSDEGRIIIVDDPLAQGIRTLTESEITHGDPGLLDTPDDISDAAQTTISCLKGEERAVHTDKLRGKAWTLSNLEDCTIFLHGPLQGLYLYRLKNCRIEAGPVHSATFGEELSSCQLSLASHQIRLHASVDVQVHLRAGSDPIIEDCSRIGFGPLTTIDFQDFDEYCQAAGLQAHDAHWQQVQDFSNPGSELKKNWYIIKQDARQLH